MIIGIIGKVGSGKSACIKYIVENYKKYDIEVFSCDQIAKDVMLSDTEKFDFKISGETDFFNNDKLQEKVRKELHPVVFDKIKKIINENKNTEIKLFIIESALPNDQMYDMCDKVICIKSSYESALKRLMTTRKYSVKQSFAIHSSQKYYEKFYDKADYVIVNDGSKIDFLNNVKEVMDEICVVCKQ